MPQSGSNTSSTDGSSDKAGLADLLDTLTYEVHRRMNRVREALTDQNRSILRAAVGDLRAGCSVVPSAALRRACIDLEKAAPAATVETLNRLLQSLDHEFTQACRDLQSRLVA